MAKNSIFLFASHYHGFNDNFAVANRILFTFWRPREIIIFLKTWTKLFVFFSGRNFWKYFFEKIFLWVEKYQCFEIHNEFRSNFEISIENFKILNYKDNLIWYFKMKITKCLEFFQINFREHQKNSNNLFKFFVQIQLWHDTKWFLIGSKLL